MNRYSSFRLNWFGFLDENQYCSAPSYSQYIGSLVVSFSLTKVVLVVATSQVLEQVTNSVVTHSIGNIWSCLHVTVCILYPISSQVALQDEIRISVALQRSTLQGRV